MDEKCGGKHYWDLEMGYCVACGENYNDWFTNRYEKRYKPELFCDCGASKTVNPNLHSNWCSAYREEK